MGEIFGIVCMAANNINAFDPVLYARSSVAGIREEDIIICQVSVSEIVLPDEVVLGMAEDLLLEPIGGISET